MSITIEGKENMHMFQLLQWKGALKLEIMGLRHSSGRSVCAHVKKQLGFKGSREKVLAQLEAHIEDLMKKREEERDGTDHGQADSPQD